jgi:hypothetical protein
MKRKTSAATCGVVVASTSATTLVMALVVALFPNRTACAAEHEPYIDWTTAPCPRKRP